MGAGDPMSMGQGPRLCSYLGAPDASVHGCQWLSLCKIRCLPHSDSQVYTVSVSSTFYWFTYSFLTELAICELSAVVTHTKKHTYGNETTSQVPPRRVTSDAVGSNWGLSRSSKALELFLL